MAPFKSNIELDEQYLGKINNVTFNPIFIMGVPRSGTSILYKILSATSNFNIVTSYHILKYSELLHNYINNIENQAKNNLADFFKENLNTDRIIDRMQITPDFAEEYGFILGEKAGHPKISPKTNQVECVIDEQCWQYYGGIWKYYCDRKEGVCKESKFVESQHQCFNGYIANPVDGICDPILTDLLNDSTPVNEWEKKRI